MARRSNLFIEIINPDLVNGTSYPCTPHRHAGWFPASRTQSVDVCSRRIVHLLFTIIFIPVYDGKPLCDRITPLVCSFRKSTYIILYYYPGACRFCWLKVKWYGICYELERDFLQIVDA